MISIPLSTVLWIGWIVLISDVLILASIAMLWPEMQMIRHQREAQPLTTSVQDSADDG